MNIRLKKLKVTIPWVASEIYCLLPQLAQFSPFFEIPSDQISLFFHLKLPEVQCALCIPPFMFNIVLL